jgi:hypothetical protein
MMTKKKETKPKLKFAYLINNTRAPFMLNKNLLDALVDSEKKESDPRVQRFNICTKPVFPGQAVEIRVDVFERECTGSPALRALLDQKKLIISSSSKEINPVLLKNLSDGTSPPEDLTDEYHNIKVENMEKGIELQLGKVTS